MAAVLTIVIFSTGEGGAWPLHLSRRTRRTDVSQIRRALCQLLQYTRTPRLWHQGKCPQDRRIVPILYWLFSFSFFPFRFSPFLSLLPSFFLSFFPSSLSLSLLFPSSQCLLGCFYLPVFFFLFPLHPTALVVWSFVFLSLPSPSRCFFGLAEKLTPSFTYTAVFPLGVPSDSLHHGTTRSLTCGAESTVSRPSTSQSGTRRLKWT